MEETNLITLCREMRENFRAGGKSILDLKDIVNIEKEQFAPDQFGEAMANIMLAYRHMEDCIMRLGKVIQARDGGESFYSNPVNK